MKYTQYSNCRLCPRECGVDRNGGKLGVCAQNTVVKIGRAALHFWEEPCISGEKGSGTVFFSGCSLKCCYCQNYKLSRGKVGKEVSVKELADIFLDLQGQGAHNINLVTGEHFAPHIKDAVIDARMRGLEIPIILNSSGYVSENLLELLEDVIDIYLVDFKYMDNALAKEYSQAEDYPETAKKAISKMVEFTGESVFDDEGMLKKGVIVRHLCLPSHKEDTKRIIEYLFDKYDTKIIYSIMRQYTPVRNNEKYPQLNRRLSEKEYDEIIDFCLEKGLTDAYIQDDECASESFIPEFN